MVKTFGFRKKWLIFLPIVLLLVGLLAFTVVACRAPKIDVRAVYERYTEKDGYVPYEKIPKKLIDVTLAAEDHRFYRHHGIDYLRVAKAFLRDIYHGALVDGASTIPMQLSKNFLTNDAKTFERKIFDAHYARELESCCTKEELLAWYINSIGLSRGVEGVREGAEKFLAKSLMELSVAECAYLVGITNHPKRYTPFTTEPLRMDAPMVYISKERGTNDPEIVCAMIRAGKIDPALERMLLEGKIMALGARENPTTYQRQRYILRRMYELKMLEEDAYKNSLRETIELHIEAFQKEGVK